MTNREVREVKGRRVANRTGKGKGRGVTNREVREVKGRRVANRTGKEKDEG